MSSIDLAALARPKSARYGPPDSASAGLTYAELVWIEKRHERWIRFGRVSDEQVLDRRTRYVGFRPGAVFAFVRWVADENGRTALSRLDILRAVHPGEPCSTVPGVAPGGEPLLRVAGWPKVRRALEAIDAVEDSGFDPADAAPDWWRHVHGRIAAGEPFRPYTRERHRAWLLRRELAS